jgi:two-component SAPR family response regulator
LTSGVKLKSTVFEIKKMNIKIELKQIITFQEDKFHILPTLSKSSLNWFDISDLSPTKKAPVMGLF